jgi:hypothetical protein
VGIMGWDYRILICNKVSTMICLEGPFLYSTDATKSASRSAKRYASKSGNTLRLMEFGWSPIFRRFVRGVLEGA